MKLISHEEIRALQINGRVNCLNLYTCTRVKAAKPSSASTCLLLGGKRLAIWIGNGLCWHGSMRSLVCPKDIVTRGSTTLSASTSPRRSN